MNSIVDLITDEMETLGEIKFTIEDQGFFDQSVKEYNVFYKILGESRIKLFRNNQMELVFVRLNDDWMRQGKIKLTGYSQPMEIVLKWDNSSVDELAVKNVNEPEYKSVVLVQIDN